MPPPPGGGTSASVRTTPAARNVGQPGRDIVNQVQQGCLGPVQVIPYHDHRACPAKRLEHVSGRLGDLIDARLAASTSGAGMPTARFLAVSN